MSLIEIVIVNGRRLRCLGRSTEDGVGREKVETKEEGCR